MPGWILFGLSFLVLILGSLLRDILYLEVTTLGIVDQGVFGSPNYFVLTKTNVFRIFSAAGIIVGLVMVGFSRESEEDEFFNQLRLDSLVWALYVSYGLLILGNFFVFGMAYFTMLVFNMYAVLFLFVARYEWKKTNMRRRLAHEEQS